jgi:polar amino acid transport system permease protein
MQKFLSDAVEFVPILLQGVWLTIVVTIGSLALSTVLGLFWALMRVSGIGVLVGLSAGLINVIRGIPIIVLLFYLYFVMPDFGIALTALQASILGLGIAYSAYQAENFRAGIEAIDPGQIEAAHSIGMGWWLVMRRVVLPQITPGLLSGSLIVFGLSASALAIPGLLGGRRLKMVATLIYDEYLHELNWPLGAAIAIIVLIVNLVIMLAYHRAVEARARRTLG